MKFKKKKLYGGKLNELKIPKKNIVAKLKINKFLNLFLKCMVKTI